MRTFRLSSQVFRVFLNPHHLTNLIGKGAEFGHRITSWKVEEEVVKEKNQEVLNGTGKKTST